jgi:hypothetical protein
MDGLDHVAILVETLEVAVAWLQDQGLKIPGRWEGRIEEFPGEGTRELYLAGPAVPARMLLVEPLPGEGPYARAMRRRGPGIHHLGLCVPDPLGFARESGWLVHPECLASFSRTETLWLARPGVGCLLEVSPGGSPGGTGQESERPQVEEIEIPVTRGLEGKLQLSVAGIRLPGVRASRDSRARIRTQGTDLVVDGGWIEGKPS